MILRNGTKKLLVQLFNSAGRQLARILADPAAILEIRERFKYF